MGSCELVLNFEAKGFTDILWKNSADAIQSKFTCVFSRPNG